MFLLTKQLLLEAGEEDTLMHKDTTAGFENRLIQESRLTLEDYLREGARKMLQKAIDEEVNDYLEGHRFLREEGGGRQLVVRNGKGRSRLLQTGIGNIEIRQARVHDRRTGQRFTSAILPPYLRRVPTLEALLPVLYLKGISGNDFTDALSGILGHDAMGLSSNSIMRLKEGWQQEYEEWNSRDMGDKRYVYFWADGIHFNVRLSSDRPCLLVIIGTLEDGTKELVAMVDGARESTLSWKEVLLDLKRRGLKDAPKLAVGDGALGFWAALEEVFPETRIQRCWVHKTANILDKLPKKVQPSAKTLIHEMYMSDTKENALKAYDDFIDLYQDKYPKAVQCLTKDSDNLFTFYDFPAAHWIHIRTTNPIESTFSTVRHRQRQTKGCGSVKATISMAFKLSKEAEKHWRKIHGFELIFKVLSGVKFIDGVEEKVA